MHSTALFAIEVALFSSLLVAQAPTSDKLVETTPMTQSRLWPASTPLRDGRVLVTGGFTLNPSAPTAEAEIYDPAVATWTRIDDMAIPRYSHQMLLLQNGKVLVVGGSSDPTVELFDPATEKFQTVGEGLPWDLSGAAPLADGRVFVMGLAGKSSYFFDPATVTIAFAGAHDDGIPIGLPDGRLVTIGDSSALIYDVHGTSLQPIVRHPFGSRLDRRKAIQLLDGNILIAGGSGSLFFGPWDTLSLLYNPRLGTVTQTSRLHAAQEVIGMALLNDGRVLTKGGYDSNVYGDFNYSPEIYDPGSGNWTSLTAPSDYAITPLKDGRVLFTGEDDFKPGGPTAYLYNPAPVVRSAANPASTDSSARLDSVAPGSLTSFFGSQLKGTTAINVVDAAGVSNAARIVQVADSRIDFEMPPSTASGPATITAQTGSDVIAVTATVASIAPALFAGLDNTAAGYAVRIAPDGSSTALPLTSLEALNDRPVYLVLYATGIRNRTAANNVQIVMNGVSLPIDYAGPEGSGAPGLDQVNLQLPNFLHGTIPVQLTVDGTPSNTVTLNIF